MKHQPNKTVSTLLVVVVLVVLVVIVFGVEVVVVVVVVVVWSTVVQRHDLPKNATSGFPDLGNS